MADTISVSLQKRAVTGKAVKRLRREGQVPAVIHNHGKDSVVVSGEYMEVARVFRSAGRHHPVVVSVDGKQYTTLIKRVDRDPRKNTLTHVVFNAIRANQKVEAEVPVRAVYAEGNEVSPAERSGLVVLHQLEAVEVSALPKDLPDYLEFDGEQLVKPGDAVVAGDLKVPGSVELKTDPAQQLASVFEPGALAAANDAAGGEAEMGDEEAVAAEHESGTTEGTQQDEIRPGGKKEFEDKEQGHHPEKK